jgi:hypothetical protein
MVAYIHIVFSFFAHLINPGKNPDNDGYRRFFLQDAVLTCRVSTGPFTHRDFPSRHHAIFNSLLTVFLVFALVISQEGNRNPVSKIYKYPSPQPDELEFR